MTLTRTRIMTETKTKTITKPRIEAVYFGGSEYMKLARVLEYSAKVWCPNWTINIRKINNHDLKAEFLSNRYKVAFFPDNAHKAISWSRIVEESVDGDRILLIDVDTFIRSNIDDIWELDFDVAKTVREYRWPLNSGVLFTRVNEKSKRFFKLVEEEVVRMLNDAGRHEIYESKFGGIHQAAIGAVIEEGNVGDVNILDIPCSIWNNEHTSRNVFNESKIAHLLPSGRARLHKKHIERNYKYKDIVGEWLELFEHVDYYMRWDSVYEKIKKMSKYMKDIKIAEIGVWKGEMTSNLLNLDKENKHIHMYNLIDPWKVSLPGTSWHNSGSALINMTQGKFNSAMTGVMKIIRPYRDRVRVYRRTSESAVDLFEDRSLHLVFIDGDHSFDGVSNDINLWLPKVKPGGYICGHDYDYPQFPGVKEAVDSRFRNVEVCDDFTWFHQVRFSDTVSGTKTGSES